MFLSKSKNFKLFNIEQKSPSSERRRKLSTESNSGIFTITESFEYGSNNQSFQNSEVFKNIDSDCSSNSSCHSLSTGTIESNHDTGDSLKKSTSTLNNFKTNFLEIRNEYLNIYHILRIVACLFCFYYCYKYAYRVYTQYATYGTIVTLEYEPPRKTLPPALSICSHCVLCTISEQRLVRLPIDHVLLENNTWHWVNNSGIHKPPPIDMNIECLMIEIFGTKLQKCEDLVEPVISLQEGHKCITYFSNLNAQILRSDMRKRKKLIMDYNYVPKIVLNINGTFISGIPTGSTFTNVSTLKDPERSTLIRRTGIYLKLHERNLLPDMKDLKFHQIKQGVKTAITFTKRTVKLLPKPYKTGCYNYSGAEELEYAPWQKDRSTMAASIQRSLPSGFKFYRSRGECILYCLWRQLNTEKCVNFYSIVIADIYKAETFFRRARFDQNEILSKKNGKTIDFNNYSLYNRKNPGRFDVRFCLNSEEQYIKYVNTKSRCVSFCPDECYNEIFDEDNIQENDNDRSQLSPLNSRTQVTIEWAVGPVTNVYHNKRMDSSEFFATLGGHLHIWIGFSVPFFIKFVLSTSQKYVFPFLKNRFCS